MSKRSSRGRRREPIRRPIPAARLSAGPARRDADLSEQRLLDGWPLDEDTVRVRLARREDMAAVGELVTLAGVELEPEVVAAVETGVAAAALRAAVRADHDAFLRHLGEQIVACRDGDLTVPFQQVTLVLVAEHEVHGVVGAVIAHPPIAVLQQVLAHVQGAGPQQALKIMMSGAMTMARITALAVSEQVRGRGIGSELLRRCQQVLDHAGYMIVYGQAQDREQLLGFYRRHGYDVLDAGTGFDPWVVLGVHADVRPDPGERTFIWHRHSPRSSSRIRSVPAPRTSSNRGGRGRFDPGTLALHDAHLPYVLQHASGDVLAVQVLPLLWVKLAEGLPANACVDACATLQHAYEQFGISAQLLPTGVILHHGDGTTTEYATDRPRWTTYREFIGHVVLVLPELGKLVDPTIEQVPAVRAFGMGPIIGAIPPDARQALQQGGTSFAVTRQDLGIEYAPVHPEHRDVLTHAPLLTDNTDAHRRAGINLATLTLQALRAEGIVDRVRQAPFPRIHALLDTIGDAPIDADDAGDVRITLPDGAGGTVNLRLDDVALTTTPAKSSRTWWGARRTR